jgi:hypothetical protein
MRTKIVAFFLDLSITCLALAFWVGRRPFGYTWRLAKGAAYWRSDLGFTTAEAALAAEDTGTAEVMTRHGERITFRLPLKVGESAPGVPTQESTPDQSRSTINT